MVVREGEVMSFDAILTPLQFYNERQTIANGHYAINEDDGTVSIAIVTDYSTIEFMNENEYAAWHDRETHRNLWQSNMDAMDLYYDELGLT